MLQPKKSFGSAFKEAKNQGKKTFSHQGKSYTTETAEEKARKQTPAQNLKSVKFYEPKAKEQGYKNIALNTISDSYIKVYGEQKMTQDKMAKNKINNKTNSVKEAIVNAYKKAKG